MTRNRRETTNAEEPSPKKAAMHTAKEFAHCAERLKALADPDRLRIVNCLFGGEKNVGQIAAELGDEIVKVSHHLGVLRHAQIVETEKHGRFVNYRLHPDVMAKAASDARAIDFGCCRIDLQ